MNCSLLMFAFIVCLCEAYNRHSGIPKAPVLCRVSLPGNVFMRGWNCSRKRFGALFEGYPECTAATCHDFKAIKERGKC